MRIIIFLVISFSLAAAMEPQPLSVEKLDRYTLVGNDSKEIVLDGTLVRDYLPGLADKFRQGMIEARTGKIRLNDLDGQALANLKSLIEGYSALEQGVNRQKEKLSQLTVEEYLNQEAALNKRLKEQITFRLESLPEIGDHFIGLFKEMVVWDIPTILEEGMAEFAAGQIDIANAYELLKNIDPHVQLLYLNEADFSVDSIGKTLEWIAALENNSITQTLENFVLMTKLRTKIIDFIVQNIQPILAKNPDFKNLFDKPEFKNLGEFLKQGLVKLDSNLFTTIVRPGTRRAQSSSFDFPYVSFLGGEFIAFRDHNPQNNIYNFKNKTFKSSPALSNTWGEYFLWLPDLIVGYGSKSSISIYDVSSGGRLFDGNLDHTNILGIIKQVLPLNAEKIIVRFANDHVYIYRYNRAQKKMERTPAHKFVRNIVSIDENTYMLIQYNDTNNNLLIISLHKIGVKKPIKQISIPTISWYVSSLRKINDNQIGLIFRNGEKTQYYIVSIPNLGITINNFSSVGYTQPLTFEYVLSRYKYDTQNEIQNEIELYNVTSKATILLAKTKSPVDVNWDSPVVLDKNHFSFFDMKTNNFIIQFIPHTSTLSEILDEIQKKVVPVQVQPKRAAEQESALRVPAAAQGLKQEAKRQRQEKEKPNG
jgi:hypothetical protein